MKSTTSSVAVLMMSVLMLVSAGNASAQEASKGIVAEVAKQLVQALPKELVKDIKMQFIEQMKKELASGGSINSTPGAKPIEMSALMGTLGIQLGQSDGPEAIQKLTAAAKQYFGRIDKPMDRVAVQPSVTTDTRPVERFAKGDFIAVVTNQLNPVRSLTMDQIRKLFSGQYTNWMDVGGPDMDVEVLTFGDSTTILENLLKTSISLSATRARYVSLMIPLVDRSKGAIGFLPTQNVEQADFLLRHDAIKKIAIKRDDNSPAVMPSRLSLAEGTYPMLSHGSVPAMAWSAPATAASDGSFAAHSSPR
ncbi:MAG: substrate-binding domain-containing protein [Desulfomonile tiedjei]|uniref:Substrate-binding domain-containing protein n=1 Tax=Desulfomonile tiedjei TaxID=2358 RepID=A0A9D6Z549_9BACT|nr:substrate-binding domain-containing protein [Desulfomonile tiedjei]